MVRVPKRRSFYPVLPLFGLPGDTHKIVNDSTVPLVYLAVVLNP